VDALVKGNGNRIQELMTKLLPAGVRAAGKSLTISRSVEGATWSFEPPDFTYRGIGMNGADTLALHSSVIVPPLNWLMRTFPEAPLVVEKSEDSQWRVMDRHALAEKIRQPNPFYGGRVLWMATIMDFSFGEAFWLKIRNPFGELKELWWIPRGLITPRWVGDDFITYYEYRVGGQTRRLDPGDVVHFRFGMDPENIRRGFSQLAAVMREVYTDAQASAFTAAVLKNLGVIGIVIAPKEGTASTADVKEVKDYIQSSFTGSQRGATLALGRPTDVHVMQYNLQGLDLGPIRDIGEERVTAALGIPAAVVGFGTGLQQTKVGAPQPLSARLWTPTGPTTMGEVEPGQMVAIPGTWGRVKHVYPQGVQDIYRITFQDGSTAESTIDHLWDVKLPNHKERCVLPLSEIARMPSWKLRRASLPLQGTTEFEEQPTLIPPYVMGLLLADGSFRENLFFSNSDAEIVERMREEVAVGYDVTPVSRYDYRIGYRDHALGRGKGGGSGNRNPFKDELRRLGLWMLYSPEKFIPDPYKYNSSRVRRELLRGLLDGDGFVNHHGQPALEQTSARLAADVTWMVQSLGGYTLQSLKRANRRERMIHGHPMRSRHDRYHLSIVIDDAPGLFYCSEKAERCRDRTKPATRKFRAISFVRQEYAQCIEVNGGLYLTDNFIVTHNTMRELIQLAWKGAVMPNQEIIADEIDRSLLPEFQSNTSLFRSAFDTSKVRALWEDVAGKHDRVRNDWSANLITQGEARRELGYTVDETHDHYMHEMVKPTPAADETTPPKDTPPLDGGTEKEDD
jgi:hypothetical protein